MRKGVQLCAKVVLVEGRWSEVIRGRRRPMLLIRGIQDRCEATMATQISRVLANEVKEEIEALGMMP
jgi:hypothetical protein